MIRDGTASKRFASGITTTGMPPPMTTLNQSKTKDALPDTPYWRAFMGRFYGLLKWQDVDEFWDIVAASDGWYAFDLQDDLPNEPLPNGALKAVLETVKTLVNSRRDMSISGAIYADDLTAPRFIKIYDPSHMGSACNTSTARTMPRWILSKLPPDPLPATRAPENKGFLQRIFKK